MEHFNISSLSTPPQEDDELLNVEDMLEKTASIDSITSATNTTYQQDFNGSFASRDLLDPRPWKRKRIAAHSRSEEDAHTIPNGATTKQLLVDGVLDSAIFAASSSPLQSLYPPSAQDGEDTAAFLGFTESLCIKGQCMEQHVDDQLLPDGCRSDEHGQAIASSEELDATHEKHVTGESLSFSIGTDVQAHRPRGKAAPGDVKLLFQSLLHSFDSSHTSSSSLQDITDTVHESAIGHANLAPSSTTSSSSYSYSTPLIKTNASPQAAQPPRKKQQGRKRSRKNEAQNQYVTSWRLRPSHRNSRKRQSEAAQSSQRQMFASSTPTHSDVTSGGSSAASKALTLHSSTEEGEFTPFAAQNGQVMLPGGGGTGNNGTSSGGNVLVPKTYSHETASNLFIFAELPGSRKRDVILHFDQGMISITAARGEEEVAAASGSSSGGSVSNGDNSGSSTAHAAPLHQQTLHHPPAQHFSRPPPSSASYYTPPYSYLHLQGPPPSYHTATAPLSAMPNAMMMSSAPSLFSPSCGCCSHSTMYTASSHVHNHNLGFSPQHQPQLQRPTHLSASGSLAPSAVLPMGSSSHMRGTRHPHSEEGSSSGLRNVSSGAPAPTSAVSSTTSASSTNSSRFMVTLRLPDWVDKSKLANLKTSFANGLLEVCIPKVVKEQPSFPKLSGGGGAGDGRFGFLTKSKKRAQNAKKPRPPPTAAEEEAGAEEEETEEGGTGTM